MIKVVIVQASNGSIDQAATVAKFAENLAAYVREQNVVSTQYREILISAIEATENGKSTLEALTSKVMRVLNVPDEQFTETKAKVKSVLDNDPAFIVKQGRGGTSLSDACKAERARIRTAVAAE